MIRPRNLAGVVSWPRVSLPAIELDCVYLTYTQADGSTRGVRWQGGLELPCCLLKVPIQQYSKAQRRHV